MLIDRMIRAARLEVNLYEEVEADTEATRQAMLVVIVASVAAGIGYGLGVKSLVIGTVGALASWCVWAFLTYIIGTTIFKGPETSATFGELLRTIGFSASPGVVRVLGIIPPMRSIVFLVAGIWCLIAMVIAVRQALDFTTARAVGTCIVGWVVQVIILVIILSIIR